MLPSQGPGNVDAVFHALGDPTRRAIMTRLAQAPASITDLATNLGITKTAVGQHMRILAASTLATSVKEGRIRTCRLDPAGLATVRDWIDWHRHEWESRLDRLGEFLDRVDD